MATCCDLCFSRDEVSHDHFLAPFPGFQQALNAYAPHRIRKGTNLKLAALGYPLLRPWHERRSLRRLRGLERRLVSPLARLAIPFLYRGAGYYKSIRPMQSQYEIGSLYARLLERPPRRVIEIGTCHGGTLYLWCQAAAADATLVSIDLPGGEFGGGYRACRATLYQAFRGPRQTLHLVRADSHAEATAARVRELLGGPADFLFIDGDHTYAGVRRDYELYAPLVGSDGWVALHDIAPRADAPEIEVWKFWAELKLADRQALEWLDPSPENRAIGIGLLHGRA